VFHTDEFGFNNPPGVIASRAVDVAAVGASFTLGHCVSSGEGIVARLRQVHPRFANFGMAGSGTLSMLGTFREYVEPLKPRVVLWIMHPWTADTRDELADPILRRYLEPDFSQHLFERREEIDRTWRSVSIPVQYEIDHRAHMAGLAMDRNRFAGFLTLSALRRRLHLNELLAKPAPPPDLGPFRQSITLAQVATESWGGRFIVVIMPLYAEVVAHELAEPLHHDHLTAMLRAMGIEVIDTVPVFLSVPDPRTLYVMGRNNHPTPAGHELLARFVAAQMRTEQASPHLAANERRRP
jgi:hypothetical protein